MLVAIAAPYAWRFASPHVEQARAVLAQRRLMRETFGADRVMYGEGADVPAARRGEYLTDDPNGATVGVRSWFVVPPDADRLGLASASVFTHARTSPNGTVWFVTIGTHAGFPLADGDRLVPAFGHCAFAPLTMTPGSRLRNGVSFVPPGMVLKPGQRWIVYAGQPDANDTSRFTVDYAIDGERGTIECRVRDDGGIVFRKIAGPGDLLTGRQTRALHFK